MCVCKLTSLNRDVEKKRPLQKIRSVGIKFCT